MQTQHCLELVYSINYSNLSKRFVLRPFNTTANQTKCSKLEQMSVIKFWWLKSGNSMKFTEECVMCTTKHVLVKKKKNVYK